MALSAYANARRLYYGIALALICCTVNTMPVLAQAGTQVTAQVCQENISGARLTISSPQSGKVHNSVPILIQGTVAQLTQIQLYVDGQPAAIIPVGVHDTTFSTSVDLTVGTHTLKLTGIDMCHVTDPQAEIVATYEPQATGGTASPNRTTISNLAPNTAPTTASYGVDASEVTPDLPLQTTPIVGSVIRIMYDFGTFLDFGTKNKHDTTISYIRAVLFTIGASTILWPLYHVTFVRRRIVYSDMLERGVDETKRLMDKSTYRRMLISIGIVLLVVVFLV